MGLAGQTRPRDDPIFIILLLVILLLTPTHV